MLLAGLADLYFTWRKYKDEFDLGTLPGDIAAVATAIGKGAWWTIAFVFRGFGRAGRWTWETLSRIARKQHEQVASGERQRRWPGALGLVALSPISAIPAAFLLTLGLAVASVVHGIFVGESIEFGQLVQGTITGSFIVILLALDVIFETFLVSLPVLGAAGYAGAGYAARSASYRRGFARSALAIGALYPIAFMFAETFGSGVNLYN